MSKMSLMYQDKINMYQSLLDEPQPNIEQLKDAYKDLETVYKDMNDYHSSILTETYNKAFCEHLNYTPFYVICNSATKSILFTLHKNFASHILKISLKIEITEFDDIKMSISSVPTSITSKIDDEIKDLLILFDIYYSIIEDENFRDTICRDILDIKNDRYNIRNVMNKLDNRIYDITKKNELVECFNNLEYMEYVYLKLITDNPKATYIRIREYNDTEMYPIHKNMLLHNDKPCHICPVYAGIFMSMSEDMRECENSDTNGKYTDRWVRKTEIKNSDGSDLF